MALEPKNVKSTDDHWKGPWGEISTSEVRCIHFVRENHRVQEIWTYPYDTLLRWVYKGHEPLEIQILAGGDTITIYGYDLERFLEPLERKRLVRVVQHHAHFAAAQPSRCCVTEIKITPSI